MKPEPTLPEKVAAITDEAELEGFLWGLQQLRLDGPNERQLIATRMAEIRLARLRKR